jgi:NADPH:quinone reductase-like Zn-dependent oxidoreductase
MRHAPTAWNLLVNTAKLKRGETVLIMGAAGNLGATGIQIAKNVIGAKVIAAAGSDDRVKIGLDLGADHGINYNTQDLREEVLKLTGGHGVDVLYDNIANPKVLPQAFHGLGFGGRLVTAGSHAGPNVMIDFSHLYHNQITIQGRPGHHAPDRDRCFAAAAEGKIKAQIERLLPLSSAVEAHRLVESGEVPGKIVLDPTLDR